MLETTEFCIMRRRFRQRQCSASVESTVHTHLGHLRRQAPPSWRSSLSPTAIARVDGYRLRCHYMLPHVKIIPRLNVPNNPRCRSLCGYEETASGARVVRIFVAVLNRASATCRWYSTPQTVKTPNDQTEVTRRSDMAESLIQARVDP